jgi:hypothetical protein
VRKRRWSGVLGPAVASQPLCFLPIAHPAPSAVITHSIPTRSSMGTLKVAIDVLGAASIVFGMVPVIGENLKSAAELASKICEQAQVRRQELSRLGNGI